METLLDIFSRTRERQPWLSEYSYFASAPHVGGMMTEDEKVILNPFSKADKNAIYQNELARLYQSKNSPNITLTPEQERYLNTTEYARATPQQRQATIASRLLTGDPTAKQPTFEQDSYIRKLRQMLELYR